MIHVKFMFTVPLLSERVAIWSLAILAMYLYLLRPARSR